ncbi:hypothetical protein PCE1_003620 [Barthelona sp. PCE]
MTHPLQILISELHHEDYRLRLNAVKKISAISLALGASRTRTEFLPFLHEKTEDINEEVLAALAEQLGDFTEYVGGPAHIPKIITVLEKLALLEEESVRIVAANSLCKLGVQLDSAAIREHFLPLIERLVESKWYVNRATSSLLFASVFSKFTSADQMSLLGMISKLCSDESPMVRKSAATMLPKLIEVLGAINADVMFSTCSPLITNLAKDETITVAIKSFDAVVAIAKMASYNEYPVALRNPAFEWVVETTVELLKNTAWRIRFALGKSFGILGKFLPSAFYESILPVFVTLLLDTEPEVHIITHEHLLSVCDHLSPEAIDAHIVPNLKELPTEVSETPGPDFWKVYVAMAKVVVLLSSKLSVQKCRTSLLPKVLKLLQCDAPEVRLAVVANIYVLVDTVGTDVVKTPLGPCISGLKKCPKWRIRHSLFLEIAKLANVFGEQYFSHTLSEVYQTLLVDKVAIVRETGVQITAELLKYFGSEWGLTTMLPLLLDLTNSSFYLYRMNVYSAIVEVGKVLDPRVTATTVLPVLFTAINDKIPNIRAKTISLLDEMYKAQCIPENVLASQVVPALKGCLSDSDNLVSVAANELFGAILN